MQTRTSKTKRPSSSSHTRSGRLNAIHWLFRSNLPGRRSSQVSSDLGRRNFFGMGEILGVITNPAETVRSLTESKRLLEEARREINENREREQLRPKHTFSRLPGFLARVEEMKAIERALSGEPSFTVLFGASSVGKTALLREVLTREKYHVLHFDLRIAGFADISSLYISLSEQMEQYFEEISKQLPGYNEFQKEAWGFKHDRLTVERRIGDAPVGSSAGQVRTSDIARLMELFQSSLLKYWEYQPSEEALECGNGSNKKQSDSSSDRTRVESASRTTKSRWIFTGRGKKDGSSHERGITSPPKEKEREKPVKKIPVMFFDEAHKLPALIKSFETMKCILDSMLVLTKQDRLCHVIHATSDPFYQTWLRQLNIMQHCKILTVGDCSKAETQAFFLERMLPRVPESVKGGLSFEALYDAFGGKLAHWQDYINDYVNANGNLEIKQSSHFLQAHSILNLHIIHSSQASAPQSGQERARPNSTGPNALHPALGAAGFKIYSPIANTQGPAGNGQDDKGGVNIDEYAPSDFSAMQLLKVMSRLSQPGASHLPYFLLCREMGVKAVDGMVKGRILDLRWTDAVTKEGNVDPRETIPAITPAVRLGNHLGAGSSGTAVGVESSEDGDMVVITPGDVSAREFPPIEEDIEEIVGPKLLPLTPIMRFAMREVVQEYEDVRTISEYASLSDVDEY